MPDTDFCDDLGRNIHPFIHLQYDWQSANIDKGLAGLILKCWKAGIVTEFCCEDFTYCGAPKAGGGYESLTPTGISNIILKNIYVPHLVKLLKNEGLEIVDIQACMDYGKSTIVDFKLPKDNPYRIEEI